MNENPNPLNFSSVGKTPYQIRFDIFVLARQHLFEQYMINAQRNVVTSYPTFDSIQQLANQIKGFVEKQ